MNTLVSKKYPRSICCSIVASLGVLLTLSACGGGGSGSGGGNSSSARTGARVLNAAIDLPPLELTTFGSKDSTTLVQTAPFASKQFYAALPEGKQRLTVARSFGSDLFSFDVEIKKSAHLSILVYGETSALGIRHVSIDDSAPKVSSGKSAVRLVHGLSGAAALDATLGTSSLADLLSFGTAGEYLEVPAGPLVVKVKRSSDHRVAVSETLTFAEKKAYTILIAGDLDYFSTATLLED